MNPDIENLIEHAVASGPQVVSSPLVVPSWPAEMADAFAKIEHHNRRVGLILVHTKHRWRFQEALQEILTAEAIDAREDEASLGILWG